jgi:hypothetical protein
MDPVTGWTGRTACALQAALRLSNESFAEHLGIGVRTVAAWHQKPTLRPKSEMQQLLDTALEKASPTVKERFATLMSGSVHPQVSPHTATRQDGPAADADRRLSADPNISVARDWLDQHANWKPGTARRHVASRLSQLDVRALRDQRSQRGRVGQRRIAQALGEYYRDRTASHGRYSARCGSGGAALTSVLTCPEWLDLNCPLITTNDRLSVTSTSTGAGISLDGSDANLAATLSAPWMRSAFASARRSHHRAERLRSSGQIHRQCHCSRSSTAQIAAKRLLWAGRDRCDGL